MIATAATIEEQRLALQAQLDSRKSPQERNRLGQFATPPALARDIVAYGLGRLPADAPVRFLDPAIGTGAFYSALLAAAPPGRIAQATGYEVDPQYADPARALWAGWPLALHTADFTALAPPAAEAARFNLLICNPPYVRHHHLKNGEKTRLQQQAAAALGARLDGLAGLYCYFLALAHAWMSAGAITGWLIPSEFMDVNYGRAVKHYLLDRVTLLRIHRFDPTDVQFADALVSSAVVFLRNTPPPPGHSVEFTFGGRLDGPDATKAVPVAELRREAKWTRFPAAAARARPSGPTLGDFFQIKRGLVTGDNHFFILTPEQIAAHDLPRQFLRPILPGPRYLPENEIAADAAGNPLLARKLFLLDCRLPEEAVLATYPALWRYLQSGRPAVSERYLCKNRKPWYSQEDRPPPPFLCTYIGRSDNAQRKPFRFILNHSRATAANVYLLLYPQPALARTLQADPSLTRRVWAALDAIAPETLLGAGRVYGGGLHKLEPNELATVPADTLAALLPAALSSAPPRNLSFWDLGLESF